MARKGGVVFMVSLLPLLWSLSSAGASDISGLNYTYPVERLKEGHSFGNKFCYVTLDRKSDIPSERGTPRYGIRESTNQKYYLLGWDVNVTSSNGETFIPRDTCFTPAFQQTHLELGKRSLRKTFFIPFENNYLRSAHYLLESTQAAEGNLVVESRMLFPAETRVGQMEYKGAKQLAVQFADGASAIIWGGEGIQSFETREETLEGKRYGDLGSAGGFDASRERMVEVSARFNWSPTPDEREFALSFVYTLEKSPAARGYLFNALFNDYAAEPPGPESHLFRIHQILEETRRAINRYLERARLWTPDPLINRAAQWAKVNQLRLQQESERGACFTNDPPSDVTVCRDTVWYLMGSTYYAQPRSHKLLDAWFRYGMEPSGKFIEYFTAAKDPIYRDDYGLNIADSTPLMIMAAHHYFAVIGDRGFLQAIYPSLLNSAEYILEQTKVGEKNRYGLVWCTSTDTFVRGLPVWRNAIPKCNIAGAPAELNAECYLALRRCAELARAMGDEPNSTRLESSAQSLRSTIDKHLRSRTSANPFYYLNINPEGEPVADMTGDLVFPPLCGVSDPEISKGILDELFSDRFWAGTRDGAGGIRTVSVAQGGRWGYQAKALPPGSDPNWNYGLLGGVWPNLALWAARAAANQGLPDLSLKALRATYLLNERENPSYYNVVPGEFNGYCNGDDLIHKEMPLSPFLPGIFIWSSMESFLGISPHATGIEVSPSFPTGWKWVAVSNLPYRGHSLSMLAVKEERTLYTTVEVRSGWKQVFASPLLQDKYIFKPGGQCFWLVIPSPTGREVVAAAPGSVTGKLVDRETGRAVLELSIPAGELVRKQLP